MISKTARTMTAKALMLVSVLLLTACDGGIFGTGGPDDLSATSPDNAGLPSESNSLSTQDTTAGATGDVSDSDDSGTVAAESDAGATAGGGATTAGDDTSTPTVDTGGETSTSTAGGLTDGDGGSTDSGVPDTGTNDAGAPDFDLSVSAGDDGTFTNDIPTLSGPGAQLVVINTSSLTLNIVSRGTDPEAVIFEINNVAPNTSSESTALSAAMTNLAIVDSNNPTQVLVSYSEFITDPSTLTTLVIREDETGINSAALVTETQTSNTGLAKVRIVQGGTLGDASLESQLRLQSAGDNPGGVDLNFGPLSFNRLQSDYMELFAGDYELIDLATRFSPVAVTLSGGSVYTLLLIGDGDDANDVLTIVDSAIP